MKHKRIKRRIIALLLSTVMVGSMICTPVFADEVKKETYENDTVTVMEITSEVWPEAETSETTDPENKNDTDAIMENTSEDRSETTDPENEDGTDAIMENTSEDRSETTDPENEDDTVTVTEFTSDAWEDGGNSGWSKTETSVTTDPKNDDRVVSETKHEEGGGTSVETKDETVTETFVTGELSVTVTPGEDKTETTDLSGVLDSLKPDTSGEGWEDDGKGGVIKTEEIENDTVTTSISNVFGKDSEGNDIVIGYITTTETKTETIEESGVEFEVLEAGEFDNGDGTRTTITIKTDEDGKVTGYVEVVETLDEDGTVVSSKTSTVTSSGTITTKTVKTTKTTKTQTVNPDGETKLTVSMGEIQTGDKHGNLKTTGLDVDMSQFAPADGVDFDSLGEEDLVFVAGVGVKSKHELTIMWGQNINSMTSKNSLYASQYIVVDKQGNKHVVYCADMSVPADSDVEYYLTNVEDADYYTNSANHGAGKNNLKDPEGGAHLREIATNGYWGTEEGTGSLAQVIQDLLQAKADDNEALTNVTEEEIKALTSDLALSATQAAIWRYGNSMDKGVLWWGNMSKLVNGEGLSYDEKTATFTRVTEGTDPETGKDFVKTETWTLTVPPGLDPSEMLTVKYDADGKITGVTYPTFINAYVKLIPDGWLNGTSSLHTLVYGEAKDGYENRMATAMYNWLCGLDIQEDTTTDLIQPSDIVEAVASVKAAEASKDESDRDVYDADVSFVLTVEPDRLNGDLLVRVYDSETGELITTRRVAGDGSDDDESIGQAAYEANDGGPGIVCKIDNLKLANGQTVTINLVGSQTVEKGAYLITATNYKDTQTFVGIEQGTRDVDLSFTLTLHVETGKMETVEGGETVTETTYEKDTKTEYTYYELKFPKDPPDPEDPPHTPPEDPEDPPQTPPEDPETPPQTPPEDPQTPPETPPQTPEEPTPNPRPNNPGGRVPNPPVPLTNIPNQEVPLADIPDEEVPLVSIPDEDVPLAGLPKTGDASAPWHSMMILSACCLLAMELLGKKKHEEENA